MTDIYKCLDGFQKKIFSMYLKRDYHENHYVYEKELHQQRLKIFPLLLQQNNEHLDHLVEIVTALGNLRYRVKDHATFEVCEKEIDAISKSISALLTQQVTKESKTHFFKSIQAFEDIYKSTLQIVSKEPLVFLIFIQDLFALYDEIHLLHSDEHD